MTFRVAFVGVDNPHGAGWRDLLLKNFDDVEITAIMPGYGGATASLHECLADVPRFDTVDDLVADGEFDGAVVCLPNDTGPPTLTKLVQAGKHVLAEKPIAGSAGALQEFVAAVKESGVAFQCGYMWRYDDAANRLREMLAEGRFGKLISIEMTFVTSDVRRRGPDHYLFDATVSESGFLNWLGCHTLDLLLYITQRPVVAVTARTGVFGAVSTEVEDGGIAILELGPAPGEDEGGAVATFVGGYWVPRWAGESRWTIRGSERWVHWDASRPGTGGVLEIHGPQPQWYAMDETFVVPADQTPGYGGLNGVRLVRDWIEKAQRDSQSSASLNASDACRNTPHSALATLELIDTIYRSSHEGQRIECQIS